MSCWVTLIVSEDDSCADCRVLGDGTGVGKGRTIAGNLMHARALCWSDDATQCDDAFCREAAAFHHSPKLPRGLISVCTAGIIYDSFLQSQASTGYVVGAAKSKKKKKKVSHI